MQERSAQQLLLHLQDHGHDSLQQAAHTVPPLQANRVHLHHDVCLHVWRNSSLTARYIRSEPDTHLKAFGTSPGFSITHG